MAADAPEFPAFRPTGSAARSACPPLPAPDIVAFFDSSPRTAAAPSMAPALRSRSSGGVHVPPAGVGRPHWSIPCEGQSCSSLSLAAALCAGRAPPQKAPAVAQPATAPPPAPRRWRQPLKATSGRMPARPATRTILDAWSKTKHAKAIDRFGRDERKAGNPCIGCHITGSKDPVEIEGQLVNANVQCESCHGPGKAHVEAAAGRQRRHRRMVKSPPERSAPRATMTRARTIAASSSRR